MSALSPLPTALTVGGAALLLGGLLTEPLRRFALRHDITDRPGGHKGHARPTPYLGGIAVSLVTLAAGAVCVSSGGPGNAGLAVLLGGAAIMAVLGLVDDLRPLGAASRLCVETAAASGVVLVGGHPTLVGGAVDAVLTVLWIVFTTNAFNLLDNMDGAVCSLCAVIGGFLCWSAWWSGRAELGVVLAALTGASVGFLVHNWHPARIFLGDSGSLFLGFTLASAAVLLHKDATGLSGPAGLLVTTLVATVDTALVMLSRYREARPLLQGGLDHAAHRLRRMGLTVRQAVTALVAFAALGGLARVLMTLGFLRPGILLPAAVAVGAAVVMWLLRVPSTLGPAAPVVLPVGRAADGGEQTFIHLGSGDRPVRRGTGKPAPWDAHATPVPPHPTRRP
ncbi:MraY family glycosyltransferase [Streptomyces gilvus]|uniref:MraY family glycosyltransferase n=1 Tax=Streptomyces gilvus TaxID=2920937 RepID=UPI001F0E77F8|nr:MraY family glycosyltransferase [Streptomyces sp. CME 23]MCH5671520.1 undecaprenyl/decaprenyl-phosphate alpha-N-acetylglucosaminyl 1-phosphate transferase [Streptomyces sp. CME 23]